MCWCWPRWWRRFLARDRLPLVRCEACYPSGINKSPDINIESSGALHADTWSCAKVIILKMNSRNSIVLLYLLVCCVFLSVTINPSFYCTRSNFVSGYLGAGERWNPLCSVPSTPRLGRNNSFCLYDFIVYLLYHNSATECSIIQLIELLLTSSDITFST